LNLRLPGPKPVGSASELPTLQGFTPTVPAACTAAWTSEVETASAGTLDADHGDPLARLAATLLNLSPADRERLAVLLTAHQD